MRHAIAHACADGSTDGSSECIAKYRTDCIADINTDRCTHR
jgi:hypothetical protein